MTARRNGYTRASKSFFCRDGDSRQDAVVGLRALVLLVVISVLTSGCGGTTDLHNEVDGANPQRATLPSLREVASATIVPPTASVTPTRVPPTVTLRPSASASPFLTPTAEVPSPTDTPTATSTPTPAPTSTLPPTVTVTPAATVAPTAHAEPAAGPEVVAADGQAVNGVPISEIVIMPASVRENVRRIFREGQQIGRNRHAFSKLGDSVTLTDHYLTRFDSGHYDLGPYAHLQPAIDFYSGSFARYGVATKIGLHAWSIFDPLWADKEWCQPEENIAACEIRLHNPSVLLIKIGSNDSGAGSYFEENMRLLLDYAISSGVIPILGTKADRFEGPDDRNNRIIRQLAAEYAIPLWDYDYIAGTLPRRGLSGDNVHMTMADANDYTNPETFERGYPVSDLTALITLHEVMREVTAAGDT